EVLVEPASGVELPYRVVGEVLQPESRRRLARGHSGAAAKALRDVGGAVERQVVQADEHAVLRPLDVDFHERRALCDGLRERRNGVLWRVGRGAAMRDDPGAWRKRVRGGGSSGRAGRTADGLRPEGG